MLEQNLKAKDPKNEQELNTAAVKTWQSITRKETQHLVMSMGFRLYCIWVSSAYLLIMSLN